MNKHNPSEDALQQQMKHLLDSIAQEPVSDELRALAEKLQALLDEQAEEASKNA